MRSAWRGSHAPGSAAVATRYGVGMDPRDDARLLTVALELARAGDERTRTLLLLCRAEEEILTMAARVHELRIDYLAGYVDASVARAGAEVLVGRGLNRLDEARIAVRRPWWRRLFLWRV